MYVLFKGEANLYLISKNHLDYFVYESLYEKVMEGTKKQILQEFGDEENLLIL